MSELRRKRKKCLLIIYLYDSGDERERKGRDLKREWGEKES
jgi:hypothetical protein